MFKTKKAVAVLVACMMATVAVPALASALPIVPTLPNEIFSGTTISAVTVDTSPLQDGNTCILVVNCKPLELGIIAGDEILPVKTGTRLQDVMGPVTPVPVSSTISIVTADISFHKDGNTCILVVNCEIQDQGIIEREAIWPVKAAPV